MKKLILLTFVLVVALSMMIPEESQAFLPDDCVENGTPFQNIRCLWYLQIALMHEQGFQGLYGMAPPAPNNLEEMTPENVVTEPVYVVNTKKSVTWHPLRS